MVLSAVSVLGLVSLAYGLLRLRLAHTAVGLCCGLVLFEVSGLRLAHTAVGLCCGLVLFEVSVLRFGQVVVKLRLDFIVVKLWLTYL